MPANLLTDGGFESWVNASRLTYWSTPFGGTCAVACSTDKHGGSYAALATGGSPDGRSLRQLISLKKDAYYEIRMHLKTYDVPTTVCISLNDSNWSGWATSTSSWDEYRVFAKYTGPTTASGYFDLQYDAVSRNVLVDDFSIWEITAAPTVTTSAATNVSASGCTGNGSIIDTGGENATRRGFCYKQGSSGDPTTADSVVYEDGSFGTGVFSKAISGLSAGTAYRIRAYAVNGAGTGYGDTVGVKTNEAVLEVEVDKIAIADAEGIIPLFVGGMLRVEVDSLAAASTVTITPSIKTSLIFDKLSSALAEGIDPLSLSAIINLYLEQIALADAYGVLPRLAGRFEMPTKLKLQAKDHHLLMVEAGNCFDIKLNAENYHGLTVKAVD